MSRNGGLEHPSVSCYKRHMGLSIHWTLSTQRELSDAVVKELAARTKAFAQKIGCEKVLGPKRGGPDEIKLR